MSGIRTAVNSVVMAFSMFSRIPMPRVEWKDDNMRWMLCAFPLVGAVIGLTLWAWEWVCRVSGMNQTILAAGCALVPGLIVGGFHLDGFADTLDALASHAEPEKKRAILKDPRVGSFAVIGLCAYFLATFALYTQAVTLARWVGVMTLAHVISRCMSGLITLLFPHSSSVGLSRTFRDSADKRTTMLILTAQYIVFAVLLVIYGKLSGLLMLTAGLLVMLYVRWMSRKQFGGMNGDIAGFFLQVSELVMLAAYVFTSGVMGR